MTHFLATHWIHGSILAIPVIAVVWALGPEVVARRRDRRADTTATPPSRAARPPRSVPVVLIALGTLGAAGVHATVIREHYGEAFLYGFFFTVASLVQLAYAALVVTVPSRRLVLAGAVGNAAVVVLWAATRFAAIPLGPDKGEREVIGLRDLLATGFEILAVAAAVVALLHYAGRSTHRTLPRLPLQRKPEATSPSSNVRLLTKN